MLKMSWTAGAFFVWENIKRYYHDNKTHWGQADYIYGFLVKFPIRRYTLVSILITKTLCSDI